MTYNRQKQWKDYRESLGNIGIMQAKITRQGFISGYDKGFADGLLMSGNVEKDEGDGAPRPSNTPSLSLVDKDD